MICRLIYIPMDIYIHISLEFVPISSLNLILWYIGWHMQINIYICTELLLLLLLLWSDLNRSYQDRMQCLDRWIQCLVISTDIYMHMPKVFVFTDSMAWYINWKTDKYTEMVIKSMSWQPHRETGVFCRCIWQPILLL